MSDPFSRLPGPHAGRLALLLEALGDPVVTLLELVSLAIVAGNQGFTVDNLAAVIRRSRGCSS